MGSSIIAAIMFLVALTAAIFRPRRRLGGESGYSILARPAASEAERKARWTFVAGGVLLLVGFMLLAGTWPWVRTPIGRLAMVTCFIVGGVLFALGALAVGYTSGTPSQGSDDIDGRRSQPPNER